MVELTREKLSGFLREFSSFPAQQGTRRKHKSAREAIRIHGKRVRCFSTVELVYALELEKAQNKSGQMAHRLMCVDLVILDELGSLPFTQPGGAMRFHRLSKLHERTNVVVTTKATWQTSKGRSTNSRPDRLVHQRVAKEPINPLAQYST